MLKGFLMAANCIGPGDTIVLLPIRQYLHGSPAFHRGLPNDTLGRGSHSVFYVGCCNGVRLRTINAWLRALFRKRARGLRCLDLFCHQSPP